MKKEENKYTDGDLMKAIEENDRKHYIIIQYLLNKNSHPFPQGRDDRKFFEDMEDYINTLL